MQVILVDVHNLNSGAFDFHRKRIPGFYDFGVIDSGFPMAVMKLCGAN
jgi:hypothetical protein